MRDGNAGWECGVEMPRGTRAFVQPATAWFGESTPATHAGWPPRTAAHAYPPRKPAWGAFPPPMPLCRHLALVLCESHFWKEKKGKKQ